MTNELDDKEIQILKANVGFGTAFKATLGFYAAQAVATLLGLLVFAVVISLGAVAAYLISR